jgi:hypothetical protein
MKALMASLMKIPAVAVRCLGSIISYFRSRFLKEEDLEEAATTATTRTARRRRIIPQCQHHLQNPMDALSKKTESEADLRFPATMMRVAARRAARMTVDVSKKKKKKLDRPAPLGS